jgi:hypothetical protein
MVPKALDKLAPEERRGVYQMLQLRAVVASEGNVKVTGALSGSVEVWGKEPISRSRRW